MGAVVAPPAFEAAPVIVEHLRPEAWRRYGDLGLVAAPRAFSGSSDVGGRLARALSRFDAIPSLARTLGTLLRIVHVVVPEGPDFDVSYSDPEVPFSVWIGIHEASGEVDDLRLAEGLLHECMHLQLTLVEALVPLVRGGGETAHSPWRAILRPVGGVLHGIYVFAVIRDFMLTLPREAQAQKADHVRRRIERCRSEIAEASRGLSGSRDLTDEGRRLIARLSVEASVCAWT